MPFDQPKPIIFTDLDGTLLAHTDYAYEEVAAYLPTISPRIPVILSTSKTLPEVLAWREKLHLPDPFMTENGSAVYLPGDTEKDLPVISFEGRQIKPKLDAGFTAYALGTPIDELQDCLHPFAKDIINFVTCSLDQAIELTGLNQQEAENARQRSYSVPMVVQNESARNAIRQRADELGYRCLQGGRFMHLQGACDKGSALRLLRSIVENRDQIQHHAIAVGDSDNDRAMLEAADTAVIVNNPAGSPFSLNHPSLIKTSAAAPAGWVEGVKAALNQTGDKHHG